MVAMQKAANVFHCCAGSLLKQLVLRVPDHQHNRKLENKREELCKPRPSPCMFPQRLDSTLVPNFYKPPSEKNV